MFRPTSCKLFHYTYQITWKNDEYSRLRRYQAEIDHNLQTIWINGDMPEPLVITSLLHEIAHAIYFLWYGADASNEEHVAIATSEGLTIFFQQNPEIFNWYSEMVTGEKRYEPTEF